MTTDPPMPGVIETASSTLVFDTSPPKTESLSPVELVYKFSKKYGVDPELALRIMQCESEGYRYADNPNSTAYGYFQILDGTWHNVMTKMGLPVNTSKSHPTVSIEAGIWLLAHEGVRPWASSQYCWG